MMVRNNDTALRGRLDGIRRKRHKFICLNDNLKHHSPDTREVYLLFYLFNLVFCFFPHICTGSTTVARFLSIDSASARSFRESPSQHSKRCALLLACGVFCAHGHVLLALFDCKTTPTKERLKNKHIHFPTFFSSFLFIIFFVSLLFRCQPLQLSHKLLEGRQRRLVHAIFDQPLHCFCPSGLSLLDDCKTRPSSTSASRCSNCLMQLG